MLEQELKDIWNNSSKTAKISIETNQLIEELNKRVYDLQKKLRVRDRREILASVIGIIIFGYLLYEVPFFITKLACVLSIIWFLFVIFKFRESKRQNVKTDLSLTIAEQLEHQKGFMQWQANLLDSIAYWYTIPPYIINFVFIVGLGDPSEYNWTNRIAESVLPLSTNIKIGTLIGLTFFYAFIIWINKRAVVKEINPLLKSLNSMLQQFKNK